MVSSEAKATMPRSAPGSEPAVRVNRLRPYRTRAAAGFTLIELMVVIAVIALASAVTSLAMRDPADTQLEREAARLSALLEAARAESRALGLPVVWAPASAAAESAGQAPFRFIGLPPSSELPSRWLAAGVTAEVQGATTVVLGPEPLIGAQRIVLRLDRQRLALVTDGLGPFVVAPDASDASR
jgi:general secretion pathway protein H